MVKLWGLTVKRVKSFLLSSLIWYNLNRYSLLNYLGYQSEAIMAKVKNQHPAQENMSVITLIKDGTKHLLNPNTYQPTNIKTQFKRGKRVTGMLTTMGRGMGYAYEISNSPFEARRTIKGIQKFCKQMCSSLELEVIAVEPIPQHHALWTSNHISWLDIPTIGSIIPTFFLSKAEISGWPVFGWLARTANTLFINRGSGDADNVSQQMADFLSKGFSVVFFPEATTTDGTAIKRIHGKLLQAAIDSGVQVQPIVMCYVDENGRLDQAIPYFGDIHFFDSIKRVLDNRPAKAYVLPLEPIDPVGKTRAELTAILQQRMIEGLFDLHQRVVTQ